MFEKDLPGHNTSGPRRLRSGSCLGNGASPHGPFVQQSEGVILAIPRDRRDPIETIVALELQH